MPDGLGIRRLEFLSWFIVIFLNADAKDRSIVHVDNRTVIGTPTVRSTHRPIEPRDRVADLQMGSNNALAVRTNESNPTG